MKTFNQLKIALTFVVMAFCVTTGVAQTTHDVAQTTHDVAQTTRNVAQTRVNDLLINNNTAAQRSDANAKVQYLTMQPSVLRQVFTQKPNALQLALPYKGSTLTLDLKAVKLLSQGFYVLQQGANGVDTIPYAGGVYYRGTVAGANGKSLASVSVFADHVVATFSDERGNFALGAMVNALPNGKKQADASNYVLFNTQDVPNPNAIGCFTDSNAPDVHDIATSAMQRSTTANDTVRVYLEADNSLFTSFGGTTATANYVTSVFNAVATVYANEQIVLQLAPIFVWATPDGYSSFSPGTAVEEFRLRRTTFDGEQAQLLSLNGQGGIAAGFNTFCTDRRYSFSGIEASFAAMPTYSWTVMVVSHEFGHCFGSRHTHWCGWQGGAIDGCSGQTEAAPDGSSCSLPGNPTNGGTIMSYCHLSSGGISFANGFGPQPGSRIRACVANRYCAPNSTTGGVIVHVTNLPTPYAPFWSIDGSPLYMDIDVAANISEGQHTVTFISFSGVGTPATQTITVVRGQTTIVNADYHVPSGHVVVNITGGGGAGQWKYSQNEIAWHNSGDSVWVPVGTVNFIFKSLVGWTNPVVPAQTIVDNVVYNINANYTVRATGKLTAHLTGGGGAGRWGISDTNNPSVATWYASDDTISINANYLYTINFQNIANWTAPQTASVYTGAGQLRTYNAAYLPVPSGYIKVNIAGANGQGRWTINNSTVQYQSGDSVLANVSTSNSIAFTNVPSWVSPNTQQTGVALNSTTTLNAAYTPAHYAKVKVNLVGGGGLGSWAVYGDTAVHRSGDTVRLAINQSTNHYIQAQNIVGWQTPTYLTIAPQSLDSTQVATFVMTYTRIPSAKISATLTGANGAGQWSVNGSTWFNSGDTTTINIGASTSSGYIVFKNVITWTTPPLQTFVPLNLDTINVNTFTAEYLPTLYRKLKVTLTGDNGAGHFRLYNASNTLITGWLNSGDTARLGNTSPNYTIEYQAVSGLIKPVNVTFAWSDMPAVAYFNVVAAYTPIQYGTVKINLVGGNGLGKWRLYDAQSGLTTAWLNSGDTLRRHSDPQYTTQYYVQFQNVVGWTNPVSDYIAFADNHSTTYTFYYTTGGGGGGSTARLTVNLTGAAGQGRWSIDGSTLYMSGDTIPVTANQYTYVYYVNVAGWITPGTTNFYTTTGVNTINTTYTPIQYTPLVVHLTGGAGQGRWTVDGSTLYASDDTLSVAVGQSIYINYINVPNWYTPSAGYITITSGINRVNATYTPLQYGKLKVNLTGGAGQGRWTIDGSTLYASGDTVSLQTNLSYYVNFVNVPNWVRPNPVYTSVNTNNLTTITATYIPIVYATLKVNLTGANGQGQWRVYSNSTGQYSAWKSSSDTLNLPRNQSYTVYFSAVSNWSLPSMQGSSFALNTSGTTTLNAAYTPFVYAIVKGILVGDGGLGKWRVSNTAAWRNSGDTIRIVSNSYLTIEFKPITGYLTPNSQTFNGFHPNVVNTVYGEYESVPTFVFTGRITGGGGAGRWRVDNSTVWHNDGDTLHFTQNTNHYIYYKPVAGWIAPANISFQMYQNVDYTGDYTQRLYATLKVNLIGGANTGAWSINNGLTWHNSGDTLHLPDNAAYAISFKPVSGFVTPTAFTYYPDPNTPTTYTITYTPLYSGTLKVNLVNGNNEGLWSIGNGFWYNSGDTLHLNTAQAYTLYFRNVQGWIAPLTQYNIAITANQTTTKTGTYTLPGYGILKVNITGAGGAGRWTIDGGAVWRNTGDTLHLPVTQSYIVNYKNVVGFTTPSDDYYTPVTNQTTVHSGIYYVTQIGSVVVNLTGGNNAGQWTADAGLTWHNSGDTLRLNASTYYNIEFKPVAGWITPQYQSVYVYQNQTSNVNATYTQLQHGVLQVELTGANNLGQWSIDNGTTWHNTGDTLHLALAGNYYYITYKNVLGWISPQTQSFYPTANQITIVNGNYYMQEYGIVQVIISGSNGAGQWSADNGNTWHNSNDTLHLAVNGNGYYISFKDVSGWITPQYQSYYPVANQTTLLVGNYYRVQYGILKVNIVGGGGLGRWTVDSGNTWHLSGDTLHLPTNQSYNIYYDNVAGWQTPGYNYYQPVANQTTTVVGTYIAAQYGILKVNITGGGGLGQWTIDNGITWHNSGDTLHLQVTGNYYYVYFSTINGWQTPSTLYYSPTNNQQTTLTGVYYNIPFATLKVNLTGASGQGLWSIDQLTWHASGDTLHIPNGGYVYVYFAPVAAWIKPTAQSLYLNTTQTTTTIGNYTLRVGTEINTPNFGVSILPNPANDYLRCITSSTEILSSPLQLHLYNSIGVLLYQSSLSANDEQTISTSSYPPGFYILQVFDPRTKAAILHKVIIQH